MQTRIVDNKDNILMIFVNDIYNFPDVLTIRGQGYGEVCTEDIIVKRGILRKIYVKEL